MKLDSRTHCADRHSEALVLGSATASAAANGEPSACWMISANDGGIEFSVLLVGEYWPSELVEALEENGCELDFAYGRSTAMMLAQTRSFNFSVVNVEAMGGCFPEFCRRLRSQSGPEAVVVGVGASVSLSTKLEAYGPSGMGVDTWMDHLYAWELLARIERAQTRTRMGRTKLTRLGQCNWMQWISDKCCSSSSRGSRQSEKLALSPTQRRVLGELVNAGHSGLEPEALCLLVWGDVTSRATLRVQIHFIRRVLAQYPGAPNLDFHRGSYRLTCGCCNDRDELGKE